MSELRAWRLISLGIASVTVALAGLGPTIAWGAGKTYEVVQCDPLNPRTEITPTDLIFSFPSGPAGLEEGSSQALHCRIRKVSDREVHLPQPCLRDPGLGAPTVPLAAQ